MRLSLINDERGWRQAAARSVQDRCDATAFDKPDIGRDAFPPYYNHRGTALVLSASFIFYVAAVLWHFMASGS